MNGFLLDTNVISELVRPRPNPHVTHWLDATNEDLFALSVLTIGEIRKGIATLTDSPRKLRLEAWLSGGLLPRFDGRVLPIDQTIAERWGEITGSLAMRGFPLPVIDGLLAATSLHHNLTLVTRNTRDVALTGVRVFDPWVG